MLEKCICLKKFHYYSMFNLVKYVLVIGLSFSHDSCYIIYKAYCNQRAMFSSVGIVDFGQIFVCELKDQRFEGILKSFGIAN